MSTLPPWMYVNENQPLWKISKTILAFKLLQVKCTKYLPCVLIGYGFIEEKWGNCNIFFISIISPITIIIQQGRCRLLKECQFTNLEYNIIKISLHEEIFHYPPHVANNKVTHIVGHVSIRISVNFFQSTILISYNIIVILLTWMFQGHLYPTLVDWPYRNQTLPLLSLVRKTG